MTKQDKKSGDTEHINMAGIRLNSFEDDKRIVNHICGYALNSIDENVTQLKTKSEKDNEAYGFDSSYMINKLTYRQIFYLVEAYKTTLKGKKLTIQKNVRKKK